MRLGQYTINVHTRLPQRGKNPHQAAQANRHWLQCLLTPVTTHDSHFEAELPPPHSPLLLEP